MSGLVVFLVGGFFEVSHGFRDPFRTGSVASGFGSWEFGGLGCGVSGLRWLFVIGYGARRQVFFGAGGFGGFF